MQNEQVFKYGRDRGGEAMKIPTRTVTTGLAEALEEMRRREQEASPGPWEHPLDYDVTYGYQFTNGRHVATWIATADAGDEEVPDEQAQANAEFIARSRADMDRLLTIAELVLDLCRDADGNWLEPTDSLPVGEFQAALSLLAEGGGGEHSERSGRLSE